MKNALGRTLPSILAIFSMAVTAHGASPTTGTKTLLNGDGALRAMYKGDKLIGIYGSSLYSDTEQDLDVFIADFLTANPDIFGVDGVDLQFVRKISIRDEYMIYVYSQEISGVPVHNSSVKIKVRLDSTNSVGFVTIRLVTPPGGGFLTDVLSDEDAKDVVELMDDYDHLTLTTPVKVIFEDPDGELHRAWRFVGHDADEQYRFFVDTNSGELIDVQNLIYNADVIVHAEGWATDGIAADTGTNTLQVFDLVGVQVGVLGGATDYCDDSGAHTFTGLTPGVPVTIETELIGEWVIVDDVYSTDLSTSGPATPVTPPGLPPVVSLELNEPPTPPTPHDEYATAQLNAFLVIQNAHNLYVEWVNEPAWTEIDQQLLCKVNGTSWPQYAPPPSSSGPGTVLFARAGELAAIPPNDPIQYRNTAFSTVISHEYMHYIEHTQDLLHDRAFGEGAADAFAALMWGTPELGLGFWVEEPDEAFRNVDEPDVQFGVCTQDEDPHDCGLALAGAFWDLRTLLIAEYGEIPGIEKVRRLFTDFIFHTDGQWSDRILIDVLDADDDDGILANGTPNQAFIEEAFGDHGWDRSEEQLGQTVVLWNAPGYALDPVEGTDFEIDNQVVPPNVKLITTAADEGSFPVARWMIGRKNNEDDALDLGDITTSWDSLTDNDIEVWIGTDSDTPCRDLNRVKIDAQSGSNWSSVVLELEGHLLANAQAYPDSIDDGGRVSGTVAGTTRNMNYYAVGLADDDPGTLSVGGILQGGYHQLQEIPTGSTFSAETISGRFYITADVDGDIVVDGAIHRLSVGIAEVRIGDDLNDSMTVGDAGDGGLIGGKIDINGALVGDLTVERMLDSVLPTATFEPVIEIGDLDGTLTINDDLNGTVTVLGNGGASSEIIIDGDLLGSLTIDGNMAGDISITGNLDGTLTIDGTFTGDVCAANIIPGETLPAGLDIATYGTGATFCGAKYCTASSQCPYTDDHEWCTVDTCQNSACIAVCNERTYGDVKIGGGVDINDILAVNAAFSGTFTNCGNGTKSGCDVWKTSGATCSPQDEIINLDDIMKVNSAFGASYACTSPCECGESLLGGGSSSGADGPVDAATQIIAYLTTAAETGDMPEIAIWSVGDTLAIWCLEEMTSGQIGDVVTIATEALGSAAAELNEDILETLIDELD